MADKPEAKDMFVETRGDQVSELWTRTTVEPWMALATALQLAGYTSKKIVVTLEKADWRRLQLSVRQWWHGAEPPETPPEGVIEYAATGVIELNLGRVNLVFRCDQ